MLLQFPKTKIVHRDHAPTADGCGDALVVSRAASAARSSAVKPARRAVSVPRIDAHHSAGMVSRCGHLRTAATPAPISAASASADGQSPTTSRNEAMDRIECFLGQLVLNSKAMLSLDPQKVSGQNVRMADGAAASAYRDHFARRVVWARVARGWNQTQMAEFLGIDQGKYKQYETGRKSFLPHHLVGKFCDLCLIDERWLFKERGKGPAMSWEQVMVMLPPARPKRRKKKRVA